MIDFENMGKQERIAWVMTGGSALIVLYLLGGYADLLSLENGFVSSAPGLLRLCIEAAVASAILELGAGFIRRRREDTVDLDERDQAIQSRANIVALMVFGLLVSGTVFWTMPMGFLGIKAISTGTLGGGLICAFAVSTMARHIAEIALYKRG